MTATAAYIITNALRMFGIIDQTENPTATDIANNVAVLNDLLRSEQADGAAQYLMRRLVVQLPAGAAQQVYTFSIGTADPAYAVQVDAVGLRALYMNDINLTVNRTTRQAPIADVVRTTYPGIINKWHQERQADGSLLITAWQPPRAAAQALLDYGARLSPIIAVDGSDIVGLPPEGIVDAVLLLGRRVCKSYGVVLQPADPLFIDAERANARWRDWARGQQWLRFVRS